MVIGVDFDNTIVCYDGIFHRVARERGWIPPDLPTDKSSVRNFLRQQGRESDWIEMQGYVYGPRLAEAEPYPGVLDFFRTANALGIGINIISHKTRRPFLGEPHDLHEAAWTWLESRGFFDSGFIGLARSQVFLELTKEDKHQRIADTGCTHFIDDLPEFLLDAGFPGGVERFLFDPNGLHGTIQHCASIHSWQELAARFLEHTPAKVTTFARRILAEDDITIEQVPGGGNNRIFRAAGAQARAIIKAYHHDQRDARDRYTDEQAFYTLLTAAHVGCTPTPLGWDPGLRLGAFTEISGAKPEIGQVTEDHVDQTMHWLQRLQQARAHPLAASIGPASDSCFSLQGHLECVERRVRRLHSAATDSSQAEFSEFVTARLIPRSELVFAKFRSAMASLEDAHEELEPRFRCLSPSDFGYHNTLLDQQGNLWFLDFEYAGWDDPAKLACDFFCQPQVPVPLSFVPLVLNRLNAMLGDTGMDQRFHILLPLHALKWCCILLNEFLEEAAIRRHTAQGGTPIPALRSRQLRKAQEMLATFTPLN